MATLQDVIRRITIQGSTQGVDQTTASLEKLATAQGAVAVATTTTDKATLSAQTKLNSLQRSVDGAYASEQKMASAEKTLAAARNQGIISAERENELLTLSAAKYAEAGAGAELMAKGEELAAEAGKGLLLALGPLVALTALAELPNKIMESAEAVAKVGDTAENVDLTTKSLQELDYAATQNGVSTDTMNSALQRFSKNLGIAATGTGDLAKVLKENDVAITGNTMKDLENFANLVQNATSAEQRNYLTTTALGKGAADLGRVFNDGADGIKRLADEADNANVILSDGTIETAKQLHDEFASLETQLNVSFEEFTISIAPALEAALGAITTAVQAANAVVNAGKASFAEIGQMSLPLEQRSDEWIQTDIANMKTLIAAAQGTMDGSNPSLKGILAAGAGGGSIPHLQQELADDQTQMTLRNSAFYKNTFYAPKPAAAGKPTVTKNTSGDASADRQARDIQRVTDSLNLQIKALTETDRQKEIDEELARAHVDASSKEGQAITALAGKYYDEKTAIKSVDDATAFFAQTTESAFEGLITGGESLTDVLGDVEKALMNAVIQAELLGSGPLAGILGTAPTTAGQTGGLLGSLGSMISGAIHPNAMGGAYASPDLSALSGQILTKPTLFKFAMGAAGEAGPEAIMPLKRGADGRLGVAAANSNSGSLRVEIYNDSGQPVAAKSASTKKGSDGVNVVQIVLGAVKTGLANGSLDSTMSSVYGLKRVGR